MPPRDSLLDVATGEWKGLVLFGVYTGQRLGDLTRLRRDNCNMEQGILTLNTGKTNRRQILPIAPPLLRWLGSQPVTDMSKSAPLFPMAFAIIEKKGTVGTLSNQFNRILCASGLVPERSHRRKQDGKGRSSERAASELSFHSLRHTATSLMKNAGISPAIVQEFVGHDSKAVSENYTHIEMASLRTALAGIPDLD